MQRKKSFGLPASAMKSLVPDLGGCVATDRITCDGCPVGFMYRELPDYDGDSVWRFLAGDETQDYMGIPGNHGVYEVNTIANYDPEIVEYVDAPTHSAFERRQGTKGFVPVPFPQTTE
jgi:hypothetical protein